MVQIESILVYRTAVIAVRPLRYASKYSRSPGKARMNDVALRTYSLASCYENSFTTILRLGSRQQAIQESQVFRNNMRAALKAAMVPAGFLRMGNEAVSRTVRNM